MVSALQDAISRGGGPRQVQPAYGYYRMANGWITVSPMGAMDELKYRREGWEPLARYGRFEMASEWAADHPFEALFMRGGAREMPVDQLIQSGLLIEEITVPGCRTPLTQMHNRHNPSCFADTITVHFPQAEGLPPEMIGPFGCKFCDRVLPTPKALSQHESVMHRDEAAEIRTGQALADALIVGLGTTRRGQEEQSEIDLLKAQIAALSEEIARLNNKK